MATPQSSEGLVNVFFGQYPFNETKNVDNGVHQSVLTIASAAPGCRQHFKGIDLTFNLVTGVIGNDRIDWVISEEDILGSFFPLWTGRFNCKAVTGENAGQQGFETATQWIGFERDTIDFKWTSGGAIVGSIFSGNISASSQVPHFAF